MRHLQFNLGQQRSGLQIRVFPSIQSEDFTHYLADTGMYFLMCHDGASTSALSTKKLGSHPISDHHDLDGGGSDAKVECGSGSHDLVHQKIRFRYMIYEFIRQGYNVALLHGLEWRDTKVRLWSYGLLLTTISFDCVLSGSQLFLCGVHLISEFTCKI